MNAGSDAQIVEQVKEVIALADAILAWREVRYGYLAGLLGLFRLAYLTMVRSELAAPPQYVFPPDWHSERERLAGLIKMSSRILRRSKGQPNKQTKP